jgi:KH domain
MKQLVEDIAKGLVDIPAAVSISVVEDEQGTVLELKVAASDLGKVIGRPRPYRQRHSHDSQRRGDETESPRQAGDPRISLA